MLACQFCITWLVIDAKPFLAAWSVVLLLWMVAVGPARAIILPGLTRFRLFLAFVLLGGFLPFLPPLFAAAWAIWLLVVVLLRKSGEDPRQRKLDLMTLLLLLAVIPPSYVWWNRPWRIVGRLGNPPTDKRAIADIEALQASGTDMRPWMLEVLQREPTRSAADEMSRRAILKILGRWKDPCAVPYLLRCPGADEYLDALEGQEAINALIAAGYSSTAPGQKGMADLAATALTRITGQKFGTDWARWEAWAATHKAKKTP